MTNATETSPNLTDWRHSQCKQKVDNVESIKQTGEVAVLLFHLRETINSEQGCLQRVTVTSV